MECSICFQAITSETGKVDLSCSHSFHLSCLMIWFEKRKHGGNCENCPLCRHEANEFEKMPAIYGDDSESEWGGEESDLYDLAAQERARGRFNRYKALNPMKEVELYAANLIKACWRGYQDRLAYNNIRCLDSILNSIKLKMKHCQEDLLDTSSKMKFARSILGLTRFQIKNKVSTAIQALWRGYHLRLRLRA